jgi:BirA family biotin operon repressor/biotin-[acetyl-CoA-carboxylase] ligase
MPKRETSRPDRKRREPSGAGPALGAPSKPARRRGSDLHPARVFELCGTARLARPVVFFESADSTNAVAMEAASKGAPEGLLVIAEQQRRGRGRKGRTWSSVRGKSLVFSLLLRPACRAEGLTAVLALAAVEVLARLVKDVGIKWPNDILIGGGKVAGILAEAQGDYVVIGMGMNVNESAAELPVDVRPPAVSLALAVGRQLDRGRLLARIVKTFERLYERFEREGFKCMRDEIEDRLLYIGKAITVTTGDATLEGGLLGITEEGYLRLAFEGQERIVSSADVTLREARDV